jgi:NAD(P)-dependent dehydrogenase (short-subunit alcohol dehydrogenase family)
MLTMDVTDVASVDGAVAALQGQAVDVLLNTAGITGRPAQTEGDIDYASWAQVFDVNTMGPARVTTAFGDAIVRGDRKLVVTISSGMGSLADNITGGSMAYRSSKAAVNMVMRTLAVGLAPRGISCVLVSPGWVRTDMGGEGATLTPCESVAALIRVIATLGMAQSGKFLHYDGREHAW